MRIVSIKRGLDFNEAKKRLENFKVDGYGVEVMARKMANVSIFIKDIPVRAANILKQEALAQSADLALPKEASLLKVKQTDGYLIGNIKRLEGVAKKLLIQPFGLDELGKELREKLKGLLTARIENKPLVMGILNITPDSFSDGGNYFDVKDALNRAKQMIKEGVDIIDIGGESTGPGSKDVKEKEELKRVIPIIKEVKKLIRNSKKKIIISIDTYKAKVAKEAIKAGASMVNDVLALRGDAKMAKVLAKSNVQVVLMYSKDKTGRTTARKKDYTDVVYEISDFFTERIAYAEKSGIKRNKLILDPGMGAFVSSNGKYSLQILKRLNELTHFGNSLLVGPSRKSFIKEALKTSIGGRLEGSMASACVALMNGARIIRMHDVKEARKVADMVHAIITS